MRARVLEDANALCLFCDGFNARGSVGRYDLLEIE